MKNFDQLITPPCEDAIERQKQANLCSRDPRCDDPAFSAANPGICGIDPRCTDLNFAAAHPEICGANTDTIVIKPSALTLCEGKSVQLRTYVRRGTTETEILTGLTYRSSNQDIALIGAIGGNVTGLAQGISTISVEWMGKRAYSQVQVMAGADCCDDIVNAIVVLVDNSKSMSGEFGGLYATKLSFAKEAARKFVTGIDLTKDSIALYSFNEAPAGVVTFGGSAAQLTTGINGIPQAQSKTNIGAALEEAIQSVDAQVSGTSSHKIIVVVSDFENKLGEDPVPMAQSFFDSGGIIICVGVRANGAGFVLGNRIASGGFFLNAHSASVSDVLSALDGVKSYFCSGDCIPAGDLYASRASLNYTGFTNWNITAGHMDLIGTGSDGVSLYDLIPGNGLYVDRAGSSAQFASTIETKQAFAFTPGNQYRLTLRYAGNQRSPAATGKELVTLGDVSEEITREWNQNFTDEIIEFNVAANTESKLILQYIADADGAFGYLLDIVKLENLTTGELLFLETWDNENLTYIPPGCGPGEVEMPGGGYGYGYYCGNDCFNIPPATQAPDPIISVDLEEPAPPTVYTSTKTCAKSCPADTTGSDVSRTSTQTSIISQADADAKALAAACAAAEAALVCAYDFDVDSLLNFNCKSSAAEPTKVGIAAAGGNSTDFWTVIGGESPTINVRAKNVSGQQIDIYATVVDSLVSRSNPTHPDAMMQSGFGGIAGSGGDPLAPVATRIALSGLPIGEYEFYLYGHQAADDSNSVFQLEVGTFTAQYAPSVVTTYGPLSTVNGPGANGGTWGDGFQYVRIRCVVGTAGHMVLITSGLGADGLSRVNGFQIRRLGDGPSTTGLITINDNAAATPYPSVKYVEGLTGVISNVRLNITGFFHTNPDDVDIVLVAPDGTHIIVMGDAGERRTS